MNLSNVQEQRKLANPLDHDHLNVFSPCSNLEETSPKENTLSSFDEEVSQSILEIRDSTNGSEILGHEVLCTLLRHREVCSLLLVLVDSLHAL